MTVKVYNYVPFSWPALRMIIQPRGDGAQVL